MQKNHKDKSAVIAQRFVASVGVVASTAAIVVDMVATAAGGDVVVAAWHRLLAWILSTLKWKQMVPQPRRGIAGTWKIQS